MMGSCTYYCAYILIYKYIYKATECEANIAELRIDQIERDLMKTICSPLKLRTYGQVWKREFPGLTASSQPFKT